MNHGSLRVKLYCAYKLLTPGFNVNENHIFFRLCRIKNKALRITNKGFAYLSQYYRNVIGAGFNSIHHETSSASDILLIVYYLEFSPFI